MEIIVFEELGSTQDKVMELIDNGIYKEASFIVANKQIKGRGRAYTRWTSSEGCLTLSYAISEKQSVLNILFNIQKTLDKFEVKAEVKWPNDITLEGCKIGGVIIDRHRSSDIVGIGVNLLGHMEYATIESLVGKKISKNDFIGVYYRFYKNKNDINISIPNLWFEDKICKVEKVDEEYLMLESECGAKILINSCEYSYKKDLNRIVKKC